MPALGAVVRSRDLVSGARGLKAKLSSWDARVGRGVSVRMPVGHPGRVARVIDGTSD